MAQPCPSIISWHMPRWLGWVPSEKGDKVLIHNAGGGVGLAALDICRVVGAETYGTRFSREA